MLFPMRGPARRDWCSAPIDQRSTTPTLWLALGIDMLRDVMTIVVYTTSSLLQAKRKSKGRCTVVLQYCLHALAPLRVYMRGDDQAFRVVRVLSCDGVFHPSGHSLPLYIGYTALYWSSFTGLQTVVSPLTGLVDCTPPSPLPYQLVVWLLILQLYIPFGSNSTQSLGLCAVTICRYGSSHVFSGTRCCAAQRCICEACGLVKRCTGEKAVRPAARCGQGAGGHRYVQAELGGIPYLCVSGR